MYLAATVPVRIENKVVNALEPTVAIENLELQFSDNILGNFLLNELTS